MMLAPCPCLQETAGDISKNLAQEVESLKQALQRRGDDISYTEFVKLQRQVEALQEAAGSSGAAVQQLYDKELVRLREGLEGLQRHVGGMSGVRDVDQVFGGQLAELKAEVEAIKFTLEQRARWAAGRDAIPDAALHAEHTVRFTMMVMMALVCCAALCVDLLPEGCAACTTAHPLLAAKQVGQQVEAGCLATGCCDAATSSPSTL
jgi:hypothetical protein